MPIPDEQGREPPVKPELLREQGVALPPYTEVRIDSAELTEVAPAEYRADLVVLLVDGNPALGVVVEVQLKRIASKRYTWPVYVAGLRARIKCPVVLMVFTRDERVARWARKPIDLGNASFLRPLVVGPSGVPVVTEPARARANPELAVLSTIAHGEEDPITAVQIALAATAGLEHVSAEFAVLYFDLLQAALGEAARKAFAMQLEGYKFQSEFARNYYDKGRAEGEAKGKAEGEAEAVLRILEARGLSVTDVESARILACTHLPTLHDWIRRAVSVASVSEIFA